jgi:hypothetical protein
MVPSMYGAAGVSLWLCSLTALHYALLNSQTETAVALVEAGADVGCTSNDGYGWGCILLLSGCHNEGRTVRLHG